MSGAPFPRVQPPPRNPRLQPPQSSPGDLSLNRGGAQSHEGGGSATREVSAIRHGPFQFYRPPDVLPPKFQQSLLKNRRAPLM
jgi:hypothetical protein